MSDSDYIIRNYRASDFDDFVRLKAQEAISSPADRDVLSPQTVRQYLERPNYSPEDNIFIVEIDGNLIAYLDILPEPIIARTVLNCFVHHEHRRKGLATILFDNALRRSGEIGAKVAHVNIRKKNEVARKVLSRLGFRLIRRSLELRIELDKASLSQNTTCPVRHLQAGEESKLTEIQNRSFTGTWGFNPNTEEEIRYAISIGNSTPQEILLACEEDKPIGYCWTRIEHRAGSNTDETIGRIFMIGVDPDYRGREVGKNVLLAGLAHLKNKGIRVAELTVDSKNRSARKLYRSVGFKTHDINLWYEKPVP
jgi:mycothiol synthase